MWYTKPVEIVVLCITFMLISYAGHEDVPEDVASPFDPTLEMTDDQQR